MIENKYIRQNNRKSDTNNDSKYPTTTQLKSSITKDSQEFVSSAGRNN